MTIASLKVHCLIGLLAVAVGACKEKPDTAPPEPAAEAPDAEDKAAGDDAAKADDEDAAETKADSKDEAKPPGLFIIFSTASEPVSSPT